MRRDRIGYLFGNLGEILIVIPLSLLIVQSISYVANTVGILEVLGSFMLALLLLPLFSQKASKCDSSKICLSRAPRDSIISVALVFALIFGLRIASNGRGLDFSRVVFRAEDNAKWINISASLGKHHEILGADLYSSGSAVAALLTGCYFFCKLVARIFSAKSDGLEQLALQVMLASAFCASLMPVAISSLFRSLSRGKGSKFSSSMPVAILGVVSSLSFASYGHLTAQVALLGSILISAICVREFSRGRPLNCVPWLLLLGTTWFPLAPLSFFLTALATYRGLGRLLPIGTKRVFQGSFVPVFKRLAVVLLISFPVLRNTYYSFLPQGSFDLSYLVEATGATLAADSTFVLITVTTLILSFLFVLRESDGTEHTRILHLGVVWALLYAIGVLSVDTIFTVGGPHYGSLKMFYLVSLVSVLVGLSQILLILADGIKHKSLFTFAATVASLCMVYSSGPFQNGIYELSVRKWAVDLDDPKANQFLGPAISFEQVNGQLPVGCVRLQYIATGTLEADFQSYGCTRWLTASNALERKLSFLQALQLGRLTREEFRKYFASVADDPDVKGTFVLVRDDNEQVVNTITFQEAFSSFAN